MAKIRDDDIIKALTPQIEAATKYQRELSAKREEFYKTYRGMPYKSGESKKWATTVHPTAFNTVEWIKPYLFEVFTGDFFSFQNQDQQLAERVKEYVRFKLFVQQDGEEKIDDFLHYALTTHYGIFKVYQKEEKEVRQKNFSEPLSPEQFAQLATLPEVTIMDYREEREPNPENTEGVSVSYSGVKIRWEEVIYVGPWIDVLHPSEYYEMPGYPNIDDNPFVVHVTRRSLDYILRREKEGTYRRGTYEKAKKLIADRTSTEETETEIATEWDSDDLSSPDATAYTETLSLGNNEVLVCECYCKLDLDGDGLIEPAIVTLLDWKVVARDPIENEYRRPPFVKGSIYREPHKQTGRPIPDMMDTWQRINTNMIRAVQNSAMMSSKRGFLTTSSVVKAALEGWGPGQIAVVPTLREEAVKEIGFDPPSNFLFEAVKFTNSEAEKAGGVNESMMGLDKEAMNHTARGMQMKLTASQARQRLYARRLARAFKQVLRKVLDCLRLYPPEDDQLVVGAEIEVARDDFDADLLVKIDVGVGPQDNHAKAQILDQHLQFLLQAGLQLGIANRKHVLKTIERKYEYLDIDMSGLQMTEEELDAQSRSAAINGQGAPGVPGGAGGGQPVASGVGQPPIPAGGRQVP